MQFCELGFHLVVTQSERRTAAAIEPIKLVFFPVVNDGEKIAADSIRDGLPQAERCVGGNRSIYGAPAVFQNIEPDLRRRRNARAHHSMPRQNFRTSREIFAGDPVDLSL